MRTKFTSIKGILNEWKRFSRSDDRISETDLLAYATDAIKLIYTDEQYCHKVEIVEVKNYKATLPAHFRTMCQVAYMLKPKDKCSRKQVVQWSQQVWGSDCELEINLKCDKCHEETCSCEDDVILTIDVDRMYKQANPATYASYMKHFYSHGGITDYGMVSPYHPGFCLLRRASNNFHGINSHIKNCLNYKVECEHSYSIHDCQILTSFKEGKLLLSYFHHPVDEEGFMMIPDEPEVWEALNYIIAENYARADFLAEETQNKRIKWQMLVDMRAKRLATARSRIQMPDQDEWASFVRNHWKKVLPYYEHEENINRSRPDRFHYPYY